MPRFFPPNSGGPSTDPLLAGWHLSLGVPCYLILCAFLALLLRIVVCVFRAWAIQRGDFPDSENEPGRGWPFHLAFWECFKGFSRNTAHVDLWLSAVIGFAELAAYPVLLRLGHWSLIGAWLALKTSGQWGGWRVSRTSFNRFLLSNLLNLGLSFFWLARYVSAA